MSSVIPKIQHLINNGNFNQAKSQISEQLKSEITDEDYIDLKLLQLELFRINSVIFPASEIIDEIINTKPISKYNEIRILNYNTNILLLTGKWDESLKNANEINSLLDKFQNSLSTDAYLREKALNFRNISSYYIKIGEFEKARKTIEEVLKWINPNYLWDIQLELYNLLAKTYSEVGEFEEANKILNQRLKISNENNNLFQKALSFIELGLIFENQGHYNQAIDYLKKAEQINNNLEIDLLEFKINNSLANVLQYKGKLEETKSLHEQNLDIAANIGSKSIKSKILNNLGNSFFSQGEMELALQYYSQSLTLNKEIGDPHQICTCYINIGLVHSEKGELEKALKFTNNGLEIAEKLRSEKKISTCYINLAHIYYKQGNYDKAERYYKKCLVLDKKFGNDLYISESYYYLLSLYLEKDDLEQATKFYEKLQEIGKNSSNKLIKLRYKLGKALILKSSNRIVNKAKAQELLEEIVKTNDYEFNLLIISIGHLLELLIYEYKMYEDEDVLNEINTYTNKIYDIAQDQHLYSLLIEVLILQSKLEIINENYELANTLLTQAWHTANDKNLINYVDIVENELDTFQNDLLRIKKKLRTSSLAKRIEDMNVLEYIKRAQQIKDSSLN